MTSTSPILKIDHDCLLAIFDIITLQVPTFHFPFSQPQPRSTRPLSIIRDASQVCREWREVLMCSPWIWGRLVDLGVERRHLQRLQWMEEVVQRAGSSSLWIYGEAYKDRAGFDTLAYFIQMLQSWERIEKLSVNIDPVLNDLETIQSRFLCPVPVLKVFEVVLSYIPQKVFWYQDYLKHSSSPSLFADCAPSQRVLQGDMTGFSLKSAWLSQIHEFEPYLLDISDILSILQRMTALKTLTVANAEYRQSDRNNRTLFQASNYPDLSEIHLNTSLLPTARILEYLTTCKPRVFRMIIGEHDPYPNYQDDIRSINKILPLYILSYFAHNVVTKVLLMLRGSELKFLDITRHSTNWNESEFFLISLRAFLWDINQLEMISARLLDALGQASILARPGSMFETITSITLEIVEMRPNLRANLHMMLSTLCHDDSIRLNECSAHVLWEITGHNDNKVLFPHLQTIYLTSFVFSTGDTVVYDGLTKLLKHRHEIGFAPVKLDLTSCTESYYAQDLSALEDVYRLEVVWNPKLSYPDIQLSEHEPEICSYICPSGDPNRLKNLYIQLPMWTPSRKSGLWGE